MIFDKKKAMRNAERYLSQGKIRLAISEYQQVVTHDPRDFGTMNMLGDLHIKNSDPKSAVTCYSSVAEHYSNQGFAQKAIAVYNKISKLEPNSVEVSEKLAELYKLKGSVAEARAHYIVLAEHYQSKGRKMEALAMWKQIAQLDPKNTEVYQNLGESYLQEGMNDEAVESFREAGIRLSQQGSHDEAHAALSKALEHDQHGLKTLSAFVDSKFAQGKPEDAAAKLAEVLESQPRNVDFLGLLIDCHIKAGEVAEAEKAVIKLVEQEPANYPKFLILARVYLNNGDLDSAARILTMSSEHLLVGGQADDFHSLVGEILAGNTEHLDGLRLLVQFCSWQRDEDNFRGSLVRLSDAANKNEAVDDERYALSQLVMIVPHEVGYAARLKEINEEFGYSDDEVQENLFDKRFHKNGDAPELNAFAVVSAAEEPVNADTNGHAADFAIVTDAASGDVNGFDYSAGSGLENGFDESETPFANVEAEPSKPVSKLQKEVDSIKFYIESGYIELAEKAFGELAAQFGDQPEIAELRALLGSPVPAQASADTYTAQPVSSTANGHKTIGLEDLRSELGLEDAEFIDDTDYDTHYHTAVAYQEMGLLEDAIREFQDAVNLVKPNDGTRRFFQCTNLLGHCFMQKGMPHIALMWFQRTLETPGLSDEEKQGLWYELGGAYEAEGDIENAGKYFEQVYAENVDFRDVGQRIKNMAIAR